MTMPLEIVTLPCLSDNYAFLLHNADSSQTALVDAPEATAIRAELDRRGWGLDQILLTHHHWDHIDGVAELRAAYDPQIIGAKADAHRLPELDLEVVEGDSFTCLGHDVRVLDVSGHTVGHIAFHVPNAAALFTADSLMALGCGRLFEGTPEQMWQSLQKLAALPGDTTVYSGHEYTQSNARFALTIEPDNAALQRRCTAIDAARADDLPTVPSRLQDELDTNPFLRAHLDSLKTAVGMPDASAAAVFAEIRTRKDKF
ncbi:hydroxyacylglutathione hydrolase [Phaeobacter gallaeciensis]|uniref:Hydroxyacylglutathione hydrolase n=1 Tax=Phaeobacter gallaeciensis TaxID=60890 RepID=A0AAC9Z7L1_9RHOB|nr:hydroxyacylglutathione hydrolase [Phaeobacter gallaeciensis]AHD08652.1 hydroxyacylglutathione hydrolase [Phaeobacter gallaeciensis DSM 26640]ATE91918.1 hydroxyacylglutathione hydrolase [Phaeobacter gallaeciensis]ATE98258.1 hydroxyacylglutathione hydrolase [Phaeobacter gallaeciensis]ATF00534.1 hydroxyacylglutathione hydrolase [Phaeobacter gallaeciensis]ATF04965.1 hydroxyacylglutathione hydrolase [Phaeobacter gallaeciensis]